MDIGNFLLNTASLALGGSIIAIVAYSIVRSDILEFLKARNLPIENKVAIDILPIKLQAHERMIIFVDRINPANMLLRLHQPGLAVETLQMICINEIKTEFQHNITQQLYLAPTTWNVIAKLKDDTVAMINNAVKNLPPESSALALSKMVLNHMSSINDNPYELTMSLLRDDIRNNF